MKMMIIQMKLIKNHIQVLALFLNQYNARVVYMVDFM